MRRIVDLGGGGLNIFFGAEMSTKITCILKAHRNLECNDFVPDGIFGHFAPHNIANLAKIDFCKGSTGSSRKQLELYTKLRGRTKEKCSSSSSSSSSSSNIGLSGPKNGDSDCKNCKS